MELKDVFYQFTHLFQDYTDLLLEFPKFLPDPYQVCFFSVFFYFLLIFNFFLASISTYY